MGCFTSVLSASTTSSGPPMRRKTRESLVSQMSIFSLQDSLPPPPPPSSITTTSGSRKSTHHRSYQPNPGKLLAGLTQIAQQTTSRISSSGSIFPVEPEIHDSSDQWNQSIVDVGGHRVSRQSTIDDPSILSITSYPLSMVSSETESKLKASRTFDPNCRLCQRSGRSEPGYERKRRQQNRPVKTAPHIVSLPDRKAKIKAKPNVEQQMSLKKQSSLSRLSLTSANWFDSLLRHKSFLHAKSSLFGDTDTDTRPPFLLQEITDHRNGINCLEVSEDYSLLVSGGEDCTLRLWSTFSTPCECIGVLVGHRGYITCCTIYKYLVISGSADNSLRVWRIEDSACVATLTGHTAFINRCVCYGPLLLSSSFDNTVRIWTLTDQLTIVHHAKESEEEDQSEVDWTAESSQIAANIVYRKKIRTNFGSCLYVFQGHSKSVTHVAIVSIDDESFEQLQNGIIHPLDIVVTTSIDGTARTYNLVSGELRHILASHQGPINCLEVDPKDRQFIYTGGGDSVIKCWDVITGEHLRDLTGHQDSILCLLSHKSILYSGSADNTVRAWATEFGQCTRIFYRNTASVTCIQYFKGILFTGSNDNHVRSYDSNSAVLKQTYSSHTNSISAIKVIPGRLFTASFDSRLLVWNTSELDPEESSGIAGQLAAAPGLISPTDLASKVSTAKTRLNRIHPRNSAEDDDVQVSRKLHKIYDEMQTESLRRHAAGCCPFSSIWYGCCSILNSISRNKSMPVLRGVGRKTKVASVVRSDSEEDSGNVRLAINAIEPYIRSFQ